MGLTGNRTKYSYQEHATETEEIQFTYPSDWEDSSLAGTTVTQTVPTITETSTIQENVYIMISWVTFYKLNTNANGEYLFDFGYKIYASKAARNSDINDYIDEGEILGTYTSIASTDDLRVKAYEELLTKKGFENLSND